MKKLIDKKIIILISSIVALLLFANFFIFVFKNPFIIFKLNGETNIIINVFEKYNDPKCSATIFGKKVGKIKIKSSFDNKKVGEYEIVYKFKYLKNEKTLKRKIQVVDKVSPVITLNGDSEIYINEGEEFNDPLVKVVDNYDSNLDKLVKIESNLDNNKAGEYEINYHVTDSSGNNATISRKVIVKAVIKKEEIKSKNELVNKNEDITYINGILLVNKNYSLPSNYAPGINEEALKNLHQLQADSKAAGFIIPTLSAYRSYETQNILFNNYYKQDGAYAETYSARPGHSEHQTGLAFDVGAIDYNYGSSPAGMWLTQNCANYGFIIRYIKGKEQITGYQYEPWHIRYVGKDVAKDIMKRGITLEEYLGVA